jgi:hypothetical protein
VAYSKVVIRYEDGRVLKGITNDFMPGKERFHLQPEGTTAGTRPTELSIQGIKAVFFVKDFSGNPAYRALKEFDAARPPAAAGRKLRVVFKDGEILLGTTQGYQPGRAGFFLIPADAASNTQRCFVVAASTQQVSFV